MCALQEERAKVERAMQAQAASSSSDRDNEVSCTILLSCDLVLSASRSILIRLAPAEAAL